MARPALEVADILNAHGDAYEKAHAGHLSRGQLKVMSAIRSCRTAVLGGHVARCAGCTHLEIAYNSCRNRHCPKCQEATARDWLAARQAELLPVPYYHLVFTLPAAIGAIAYQNKAAVYDLLFRASAQTLTTIAADPRHLGARIGITAVLHSWGSALTHHPHIHAVVPGGGLSADGVRWISGRARFFLPVRVLSRLFRRLFLDGLRALHAAGRLAFFGDLTPLAETPAFEVLLAPLRRAEWVVYAKRPFAGPAAVLAYLSRYTHRVAISNSRLLALDDRGVTFRWKDYRARAKAAGNGWIKAMTLPADEFIRRFLLHVLPDGFHRIRHYGLFASAVRAANIERIRALLGPQEESTHPTPSAEQEKADERPRCRCCGGLMTIIETFARGSLPRTWSAEPIRIDSSWAPRPFPGIRLSSQAMPSPASGPCALCHPRGHFHHHRGTRKMLPPRRPVHDWTGWVPPSAWISAPRSVFPPSTPASNPHSTAKTSTVAHVGPRFPPLGAFRRRPARPASPS